MTVLLLRCDWYLMGTGFTDVQMRTLCHHCNIVTGNQWAKSHAPGLTLEKNTHPPILIPVASFCLYKCLYFRERKTTGMRLGGWVFADVKAGARG